MMINTKERREALGLSISQLASMAGIPRRALAQYEAGKRHLAPKVIETMDSMLTALDPASTAPKKPAPKPAKPKASKPKPKVPSKKETERRASVELALAKEFGVTEVAAALAPKAPVQSAKATLVKKVDVEVTPKAVVPMKMIKDVPAKTIEDVIAEEIQLGVERVRAHMKKSVFESLGL